MSYISRDFRTRVALGLVPGWHQVLKFGRNNAVPTTYAPVCSGGNYRTPQAGSPVAIRGKSDGDANDTAAGSGARKIGLAGLDATGALVTGIDGFLGYDATTDAQIATAGASASSATTQTFIRMFRDKVIESGTYATQAGGSQAADITLEDTGGVQWGVIEGSSFARSQSTICAFTIPLGFTGLLTGIGFSAASNKSVDFLFAKRENILETSAPYSPMTVVREFTGVAAPFEDDLKHPHVLPALTDFGLFARSSTSAKVEGHFELLLIED